MSPNWRAEFSPTHSCHFLISRVRTIASQKDVNIGIVPSLMFPQGPFQKDVAPNFSTLTVVAGGSSKLHPSESPNKSIHQPCRPLSYAPKLGEFSVYMGYLHRVLALKAVNGIFDGELLCGEVRIWLEVVIREDLLYTEHLESPWLSLCRDVAT
ncbi:hypothetical protein B0T21DRAFT_394543 [Apiosordaria backusii]|uniref:Uncharacterized protein n=1 Tax=Apiosordaria backusii TaxID=314023 RepID=A0AA40B7S6_9PEZI|nr:hypothetical protein B0T21DRAFT_394543 [Apiosordaria backusii]